MNLYRNTLLHIFNLVDFELITQVQSFDAIKRLQKVIARVMTQDQEQRLNQDGEASQENQPEAATGSKSGPQTEEDNFRLFISEEECENEEDEVGETLIFLSV